MQRLIALSALCLLYCSNASAQGEGSVPVGTRVRIMMQASPGVWTEGSLSAVTERAVGIDQQGFSRPGVTRVEVSEGRRSNFGRGLRAGAVLGAVLGGGLLIGGRRPGEDGSLRDAIIAGTVGGSVVLGGVIGALSHHERWRAIPIDRLQVTLRPGRESRLGLRFGMVF